MVDGCTTFPADPLPVSLWKAPRFVSSFTGQGSAAPWLRGCKLVVLSKAVVSISTPLCPTCAQVMDEVACSRQHAIVPSTVSKQHSAAPCSGHAERRTSAFVNYRRHSCTPYNKIMSGQKKKIPVEHVHVQGLDPWYYYCCCCTLLRSVCIVRSKPQDLYLFANFPKHRVWDQQSLIRSTHGCCQHPALCSCSLQRISGVIMPSSQERLR